MVVLLGCGTPAPVAPTKEVTQPAKASTAAEICSSLKASGLPMDNVIVYTEETDTNKLLGRPNQYTSKANFADTRAAQITKDNPVGGSVEVFANPQDAKTREEYVSNISKSSPMFSQYLYLKGTALLRIDHDLTPSQAKEYDTAFEKNG